MIESQDIRVLMVEDDEDDFIITRGLLAELQGANFTLDWASTFETGRRMMLENRHDVCLVDYRLGAQNGIELLEAALAGGCQMPIIMLTGLGDKLVDVMAMKAGASDYLVKAGLEAGQLERSIRYAMERKRAAAVAAFEHARLAAFGAEVGRALTRHASLDVILADCARAMERYLNAVWAQISVFDASQSLFEPRASAGPLAGKPDLPGESWPLRLAAGDFAGNQPLLITNLAADARMLGRDWAERQGVVSFAAYPLMLEDRLVGCLSLLAQGTLQENVFEEIGSVAHGIALCIQRKRAEAQIQKLAAFPRANPNPVLEFAADGALSYANDAAREMAAALGHDQIQAILPPEVTGIVRDCLVSGQKRLRQEVRHNGRTLTWSFFPVADSQVVHCYGTDITELLNLEAQFRHAQKLESVGQLAAGVAHDFNNILTVIQGYSDCLLAKVNGDTTLSNPLNQIVSASRRAATLTRQLLLFSRKQFAEAHVLCLNSVVRDLAGMLPRLIGEDIALDCEYGADLPSIQADAGMMEQVIMNLAVNARDAMLKGGRLNISTAAVEIDAAYVQQRLDAREGRFVCLTVTDTGCGMDSQTLSRIFEPFFTTKGVGKGTGLGLATVYGIVKQHRGWIEVDSRPGVGTTFKVFFPVVEAKVEADADRVDETPVAGGGGEILLLVEDEPLLRELACEILQQHEYQVLAASSGVEALKVWDEHKGQIDLVFTDMVMPEGVNGKELARQLRERKPGLKVIITSGYSPDILGQNSGGDGTVFLAKPYLPLQLVNCVRKTLDGVDRRDRVRRSSSPDGDSALPKTAPASVNEALSHR